MATPSSPALREQVGPGDSADSIVPDLKDAQAFNRYSYVKNNPIVYVDPTGHFFLTDLFEDIGNAVWGGIKAVGNAFAAAAAWLANAAASVARFVGNAAAYAWEQIKSMATNPAAIATFVVAVGLSIITLNPGPVIVWAQSTVLAIAAVSLAMAAGVRNPIVLAVIGAAAGAAAGGAGSLKDVFRILATAGAAAGFQALGVSDVVAWIGPVSAVAGYLLQNRLGSRADEVASGGDVVEPGESGGGAEGIPLTESGSVGGPAGESGGAGILGAARSMLRMALGADSAAGGDINGVPTLGTEWGAMSGLQKAWYIAGATLKIGLGVAGIVTGIAAVIATGGLALIPALWAAGSISLGVLSLGWGIADVATTAAYRKTMWRLPRNPRRRRRRRRFIAPPILCP